MSTSEKIKDELNKLLDEQNSLLRLCRDNKDILEFGDAYQKWYSRAYKVVETLARERLHEFGAYYLVDPKRKTTDPSNYVIQDYVKGLSATLDRYQSPNWDTNNLIAIRVCNQFQILSSLASRIDSVLQDVKGHLFAELQDAELVVATQLKKVSRRAAGALAGVVLERHLQRAAENHAVLISKKNPTIADLNDPLKNNGVYEIAVWRKISLMSDLRNICSHQKSVDPTEEQIDDLISGVNSIIKSVF